MTAFKLSNIFNNTDLYNQALTHRSWVNEHAKIRESNERLEFLGDAILEFIVSTELFRRFPNQEEGYLTALRANLVNTVSLSEVAKELSLGDELYLSKGEEETQGRTNISILADCVEAVIGALYIDQGINGAEKFIQEHILSKVDEKITQPLKDAKSTLQEIVQSEGLAAPRYVVIKEEGPDHDKIFTVEVMIDGKPQGQGEGKSKSEATQNAAKSALIHFS